VPRKIKAGTLETRSARLRLPISSQPVYVKLAVGTSLGYRRNQTDGSWVLRATKPKGGYWTRNIGLADDYREADGVETLTFWQAQERARELAGADTEARTESAPATVAQALDAYQADLKINGGDAGNARRVRRHLPARLLALPVASLRVGGLRKWRDRLAENGGLEPSTVNRILTAFKAALNLAAKTDERITNNRAWAEGLEALRNAEEARNVILDDDQIRAIIAAAYGESREFGLLVETAALTGARTSQLACLNVLDLEDGLKPRLMIPPSKKGYGKKKNESQPMEITPTLARKLRAAAGDRPPTAALLVKPTYIPQGRPNGGRRDVIWTAERIAEVEALAAPRPDGSTALLTDIAEAVGVTKNSLVGLFYRQRQAAKPRPLRLPNRDSAKRWGRWDHGRPFARAALAAGFDPRIVTIYALRHSSIVRQLRKGVEIRTVAVKHDTSVAMIEFTYSRHLGHHTDDVVRATLLDTDIPPPPRADIIPAAGARLTDVALRARGRRSRHPQGRHHGRE
jgi:hypothetical protein